MNETTPVLTFRLHDQRYGLRVAEVIEVMAMVAVEPLSGAHPSIAGIINRHGQPIPLIDLRVVVNKRAQPPSVSSMFIVAAHNGRLAGLMVDEIFQVQYVARFSPAPQGTPFVTEIFTEGDSVTQMMSVATLLNRFVQDEGSAERG